MEESVDDEGLPEPVQDDEFSVNVINNILDVFVTPEIERRGGPDVVGPLRKAVVILAPGSAPAVLLNDDVEVVATFKAARAIKAGQDVTTEDVKEVTGIRPARVPDNAGWIALAHIPEQGWIAQFDFRRNKAKGQRYLDLAEQYLASAQDSHAESRPGPCLDAAHTAAELAITAMMYLFEEQPLAQKRSRHSKREQWLRGFAEDGNVPSHLQEAMKRLGQLRPAARYGEPELVMDLDERAGLVAAVGDLIAHSRARVGLPLTPVDTTA